MTVEEIIRMLDNPATIGDAVMEAAKIGFKGDDKVRFLQKQQRYIDELSPHDRPAWVGEMKNLLSMYDGCSVGAAGGAGLTSYKLDRSRRWHFLDKQHLRQQLKEICRHSDNPVKVLFIEDNTDAFSEYTDEILRSLIKADHRAIHNTLTETRGEMSHILYLDNKAYLREDWSLFMEKYFELSASSERMPEEFRQNGFHRASHIIVHSVDRVTEDFLENFELYYNFWAELSPEQPIFLCLYFPEYSLPRGLTSLSHWILCYCHQYESVTHLHFTRFFKDYECYQRDEALCRCEPMCFSDAVNQLHYFQS